YPVTPHRPDTARPGRSGGGPTPPDQVASPSPNPPPGHAAAPFFPTAPPVACCQLKVAEIVERLMHHQSTWIGVMAAIAAARSRIERLREFRAVRSVVEQRREDARTQAAWNQISIGLVDQRAVRILEQLVDQPILVLAGEASAVTEAGLAVCNRVHGFGAQKAVVDLLGLMVDEPFRGTDQRRPGRQLRCLIVS